MDLPETPASTALRGHTLRRLQSPSAVFESSGFLFFLGFLPFKTRAQCAIVCRAWRDAASSPCLWQDLDFSESSLVCDAALLGAARKASGQLRLLNLTGQRSLSCRAVVEALELNRNVRELTLDALEGLFPRPEDLSAIVGAAPSLRRVITTLSCELEAVGQVLGEKEFAAVRLEALEVIFPRNIPWRTADAMGALFDMVATHNASCKLSLECSFNRICWDGAAKLADILRCNMLLTSVSLCSSYIGDAGAAQLAEGLEDNTTLTSMLLSNNALTFEGATTLSESFLSNSALQHLSLSYNDIGPEGAASLARSFNWNATLTYLDLADNNIGVGGATALAECLRSNRALTSLCLSTNSVGDEGVSALAESLLVNTTLCHLDLRRNGLSNTSASHMADALSTNVTLTNLSLRDNFIDAGGASALAQVLCRTLLSTLDLAGNDIRDHGASFLADAMATSDVLRRLHVENNGIGSVWQALLAARFQDRIVL